MSLGDGQGEAAGRVGRWVGGAGRGRGEGGGGEGRGGEGWGTPCCPLIWASLATVEVEPRWLLHEKVVVALLVQPWAPPGLMSACALSLCPGVLDMCLLTFHTHIHGRASRKGVFGGLWDALSCQGAVPEARSPHGWRGWREGLQCIQSRGSLASGRMCVPRGPRPA